MSYDSVGGRDIKIYRAENPNAKYVVEYRDRLDGMKKKRRYVDNKMDALRIQGGRDLKAVIAERVDSDVYENIEKRPPRIVNRH